MKIYCLCEYCKKCDALMIEIVMNLIVFFSFELTLKTNLGDQGLADENKLYKK
jgi:hypothetical protein